MARPEVSLGPKAQIPIYGTYSYDFGSSRWPPNCLQHAHQTLLCHDGSVSRNAVRFCGCENVFGPCGPDPYGWLENDRSEETADWVTRQNAVTQDYLNQIPYRQALRERLTTLWNYEKIGAPFVEGAYTYFYYNDGLQSQYVLKRNETMAYDYHSEAEVFLDPNTFSEDGTTSLGGISFSPDGSLVAYQISEGGSDWRKVIVMDAASKEILEDTLVDVKFSGLRGVAMRASTTAATKSPREGRPCPL